MRRSIMRRGPRVPANPSAHYVESANRETEADRLARLTRVIVTETGAHAALLLTLIERRATNVSPSDAADFILEKWRMGGEPRARLLAHAAKTTATLEAERELSLEVQKLVRPLAGKAYSVERAKELRGVLVQLLRKKLPKAAADVLRKAAEEAIDYRDDRIVVKIDGLVHLIAPPPISG